MRIKRRIKDNDCPDPCPKMMTAAGEQGGMTGHGGVPAVTIPIANKECAC